MIQETRVCHEARHDYMQLGFSPAGGSGRQCGTRLRFVFPQRDKQAGVFIFQLPPSLPEGCFRDELPITLVWRGCSQVESHRCMHKGCGQCTTVSGNAIAMEMPLRFITLCVSKLVFPPHPEGRAAIYSLIQAETTHTPPYPSLPLRDQISLILPPR